MSKSLRFAGLILVLGLASLAFSSCSSLAATHEPTATFTPQLPTQTQTPTQTPTLTLTPTPTATPRDLWIDPAGVRVHPDGGLYSGDRVSFEVEARNGATHDLSRVPVVVDWGSNQARGEIYYAPAGGDGWASLPWVWDTTGLTGTQTVTVTLDPEGKVDDLDRSNNTVVLPIELDARRPANEIGATWQTATSRCCVFHFISGTAAARDIDRIIQTADDAIAYIEDRLSVQQREPMAVYLVNRVLGHGGFAGDQVTITHLDRDYAGGSLLAVFRHEGTHMLDRQIAGGERPALLVEGFAVYVTGGHFRLESLPERVAALVRLDRYIPLRDLANNFYPSQHETGYLEGGAFIDYLVKRDGYATFVKLYDGMVRKPGESDADMIDREMQAVYGVGLEAMEAEWQDFLRTLDPGEATRDLADTIAFYDTVRRYQLVLDPSAYFLQAWIPDIRGAESRGLVADYLRHPHAPENIALEAMLVAADEAFTTQDFDRVESLLASVNAVLDAGVRFDDPIAARYLAVTQSALAAGYEPQRITLDGDRAQVLASLPGDVTLVRLSASQREGAWSVQLSR